MVFEDIHWADEGLVAFVEYLLDWGRHHPIFVLTLARPEIADRHPGFPGSTRSATTLPLEPLSDEAMDELLDRPRPRAARTTCATACARRPTASRSTRSRPCGCCATAGCWSRSADDGVVTGDLTALEVPETLHALIASRLDGVPEDERRLLQDASVLGKTFTRARARGALGARRATRSSRS